MLQKKIIFGKPIPVKIGPRLELTQPGAYPFDVLPNPHDENGVPFFVFRMGNDLVIGSQNYFEAMTKIPRLEVSIKKTTRV